MIVGPDGRVGPWPGHAWPHRTVIFARVCAFQLVTGPPGRTRAIPFPCLLAADGSQ